MSLIFIILGAILFFLPGVLLSYIVLNRTEIIKRVVLTIISSTFLSVVIGIILYSFHALNKLNFVIILTSITFALLIAILVFKKNYKTAFNKEFLFIILFSVIGVLWRIFFTIGIKNPSDAYSYAFSFTGNNLPNLGFYTGMAIDHSRFIGIQIFNNLANFLSLKDFFNYFGSFVYLLLFLSFIYLIFIEFRNKKLAYFAVAVMSLGPIELFYSTNGFFGHSFSYICLFSLFLLYKKKEMLYFYIAILLSILMIFTYSTASLLIALSSFGFIIALILEGSLKKKIDKKKIFIFIILILISLSFLLFSYNFAGGETKNTELIINHQINYPLNKYQDPLFLGLSAIRWQMLFFFLLGITFVVYCIKKYIKREKINCSYLLFCTIPVLIVSSVFLYLNYPTRIFNYFAFFGLLVLSIPEKYLKYFFIGSFIFLIISGFFVMQDKRVFFENSDKELEGAAWIAASLNGTVFCDQQFANLLIKVGYYNISGARDGDKLIYGLFYQNNQLEFLNALESLKEKNIQFIAITNRMQEKFILMLDIPQKPLNNYGLYKNIEKIYDNGDVKVFKIK